MANLHYTYYQSPVGMLKIGGTDAYIGEVTFMDNQAGVVHGGAGITDVMHRCTEELIEFFSGRRRVFNIPVYQEGTVFQQRVWGELLNIPFGKTSSYLELAKKLGDPKAIRAVAATNGKNKIAIIVPCHRVIGSDKTLVGYAGGLPRKKWLLQHEFRIAHGVQTLF